MTRWKSLVALLLALTMVLPLSSARIALAMPLPELIITEIVPASSGTNQPYEYVEIYNTTDDPINLNGYKLQYFTASPYTKAANTWGITAKVVPAHSALVLWLRKLGDTNVLDGFNANYGTSLTPDQVFEVKLTTAAQGLHDTAKRRVAIARPDLSLVTAAYYNDGVVDATTNESITFKFDGDLDMSKIAGHQAATPGALLPEQTPASEDKEAPPVPTGLTAEAGYGEVALTWAPVEAADLAGYRIYRDGTLLASVHAEQTSIVVDKLAAGTYSFTVSAVDLVANESAQSEAVAATPEHERITQEERGSATPATKYATFRNVSTMGPVVPGLVQDLVPQGAAWWPGQEWLLTTHYVADGRPSVLTMVDTNSGNLVKSLRMYQEDGQPYTGHAGGVAITGENAWVASGGFLYRIPLSDLLAAPDNGNVSFADRFAVETNASFVTYADGVLWVGEFYHPSANYNTKPSHQLTSPDGTTYGAWVAGYTVDSASDLPTDATPAYIFAIRDQIQGMAVTPDSIVLSRSYGRKNDSYLFRYVRPDLNGAPHETVTVDGVSVPLWFMDTTTQYPNEPVLTLPPLAEGATLDGSNQLYVIFESGANEYRYDGFNPLDRWAIVDLDQWTKYGTLHVAGVPDRLEVGETAVAQVLRYQGNQPDVAVTGASFAVADATVASVAEDGTITALADGDTVLTVALNGQEATAPIHVVTVAQVNLSGVPEKLTEGQLMPLKVEVVYSDGTTRDVTLLATFTTENGGQVSINNGKITGSKPGIVRVVAEYKGVASNEVSVIISPKEAKNK
jgi:hypothetical protein